MKQKLLLDGFHEPMKASLYVIPNERLGHLLLGIIEHLDHIRMQFLVDSFFHQQCPKMIFEEIFNRVYKFYSLYLVIFLDDHC
jgi:hypothetical protein